MKKLITLAAAVVVAVTSSATTFYVDPKAAGIATGASWEDAYTTLESALAQATAEGDEILLKGDSFSLTGTLTLSDHPGLAIRGGFTGEDDVTRSGRTRLVGKTSGTRFRIFNISASTVTFDGVSIEKGYQPANGSMGQGVQIAGDSSVVFTNCAFAGNGGTASGDWWTQYGGGLGAQDGTLRIVDCEFDGNYLSYGNHYYPRGGAIYAKNETVSIINTRFNRNYCNGGWDTVPKGGAVMLENCAAPLIDNCTFTTNWLQKSTGTSSSIGGSLHLASCTEAVIRDCRVIGGCLRDSSSGSNLYSVNGQAFQFTSSTVSLTRSAFYNVGATVTGGPVGGNGNGVIDVSGATSRLYMTNVLVSAAVKGWCLGNNNATVEAVNCTFTGATNANADRLFPGYLHNGGTASFANCIFWNLNDGRFVNRSGTDPVFVNCTDTDVDPLFGDTIYCHPKSQAGRYDGGWFTGGEWTTDAVTSPVIDGVPGLQTVTTELQPNGHHLNLGYDGATAVASKSYVDEQPVVSGTLQVLAYPDFEVPDPAHVTVYGTLAGTGGGETAGVDLVWDNADKGVDGVWAHTIPLGAQTPWALFSAVIENPTGNVHYRFRTRNGALAVAWSSPARMVRTPAPPVIEYADPVITHRYRTSARVNVNLTDDINLPSSVWVSYYSTDDPTVTNTVSANGGATVAVGATSVDLPGLSAGASYTYFAFASNSAGAVSLAARTFTTVAADETLTLNAAPEAEGLGDGDGWANATTVENAVTQATGPGDRLRFKEGDYLLKATQTISGRKNLTLIGGYTGEGETRGGCSRFTRDTSFGQFRIFDISASTVTVSSVTIEGGHQHVNGAVGHGISVSAGAEVTITNCIFKGNGGDYENMWSAYGGAVGALNGVLRVVDCDFNDNYLKLGNNFSGVGGALYAKQTALSVIDCRFNRNYCWDGWNGSTRGGAIAVENCVNPYIGDCLFNTNRVHRQSNLYAYGGTLYFSGCTGVRVEECRFNGGYNTYVTAQSNKYDLFGQVCYFLNSSASLLNDIFDKPGVGGSLGGGVIDVSGGSLSLTNVLVYGTTRAWDIGNKGGTVDAVNCTFAGVSQNTGDRTFAAYVQNTSGAATFKNTIFWNIPDGVAYKTGGNDVTNDYCAAETALEGRENLLLTVSPFTDASAEDFTLAKGSPCVGAGQTRGLRGLTDVVGHPRVIGRVDLGAYESSYTGGLLLLVK